MMSSRREREWARRQAAEAQRREGGFFGNKANRRWTVISGIAALAGLVVAIVALLISVQPKNAALKIEALNVDNPIRVDGSSFVVGSYGNGPEETLSENPYTVDVSPLEISLANDGDHDAVVKAIDVDVITAIELPNCFEGGDPLQATANYSIAIPTDRETPFTVSSALDDPFRVNKDGADQMSVTVGPAGSYSPSSQPIYLFVADYSLIYNDGDNELSTGPVATLFPPGNLINQFADCKSKGYFDYIQEVVTSLNDAIKQATPQGSVEAEAIVANELFQARDLYAEALVVDSTPVVPACQSLDQLGINGGQACLTYTNRSINITVTGASSFPPDTQLVIRMTDVSTGEGGRWAFSRYMGNWNAGFIEPDDGVNQGWDGHGCGGCETTTTTDGFTVTHPPADVLQGPELTAVIQLFDDPADGQQQQTLLAASDQFTVTRGN